MDERKQIETQFYLEQNHTEEILHKSVRWIDAGIMLYDYSFEPALKYAMARYLDSYNATGGNIQNLNIHQLQKTFNQSIGGSWDLYLINSVGVVERSTFDPDIGLDFGKYPIIYKRLTNIRENGEFVSDRTVKGFVKGGPNRKFAYQGTMDGKYILEISKNFDKFIPNESETSYAELVQSLAQLNANIISIELYNNQGDIVTQWTTDDPTFTIEPVNKSKIISLFSRKSNEFFSDDRNRTLYSYLFLPIYDTSHLSSPMMHLQGRIIYSTRYMKELIVEITGIYLATLFVTLLITLFLVWRTFIFFSYPVKKLIRDINRIAYGDLDHQVRKSNISELTQIESAISTLVKNLKDTILTLRNREKQLQEELTNRKSAEMHVRDLLMEVQQKENLVQESEKRYRNVVESQREFICRFAPDGTHLFVNDAYCRFFNIEPSDILGKIFLPDIPEDEKANVARHLSSLTPDHPTNLIEHHISLPNGDLRTVQWRDQAIFAEDGSIIEYQSVGRDLTELRILEKNLHASDALYRMTVNAMEDGVFVSASDHTIIICNEWKKGRDIGLFSFNDDPIGKSLFSILPHLTQKDHDDYEMIFSSGEIIISEDFIKKDNVHIETRKIPIITEEQVTTIVTIIRDITAQKEAEKALWQLNQNLEQVVEQRTADLQASLDEMDAFAYSVSHDLRGPVRAIDGFSHLLLMKKSCEHDPDTTNLITRIREGAMTMDRLIQDLLRFSRTARQPLQEMSINMDDLVRGVITELTSHPDSKDITIKIDKLHPSKGDPGLIKQVWHNLVSNSIKFTPNHITPSITIGSYEKEGEIIYYIKDQGIGFDMQYADKVFEVFSRLDPYQTVEGTGVGLALVKRIIIRHHGRIWVRSEEGRGTTFYFTIKGRDGTDQ
ncbi:MAG: PAS domain S-box protein [Methanomicrobiales archaeon]|nr:PAS domain S-box protein [Methanomicrobiales archaeon]